MVSRYLKQAPLILSTVGMRMVAAMKNSSAISPDSFEKEANTQWGKVRDSIGAEMFGKLDIPMQMQRCYKPIPFVYGGVSDEETNDSGSSSSSFASLGSLADDQEYAKWGARGVVFRVENKHGDKCIVKVRKTCKLADDDNWCGDAESKDHFRAEVEKAKKIMALQKMGALKHVVKHIEVKPNVIVLEELTPFPARNPGQEHIYTLMKSLCDSLAECHKHKILHGDLSIPNVMMYKTETGEMEAKLIDFGAKDKGSLEEDWNDFVIKVVYQLGRKWDNEAMETFHRNIRPLASKGTLNLETITPYLDNLKQIKPRRLRRRLHVAELSFH